MNKILNSRLYFLPLLIALVALLSACKKNVENNSPVITDIRNYAADPNDTVYHSLVADNQWVVITGRNLQNAIQINFNGVPASFNNTLFASGSAVVQIPPIMFSAIDTNKLYTVEYTTTSGSTTFSFKLGPGAPTIAAISNVFANPGDSVFLYGANLILVESFSYGGTIITSFKSNTDGTSLGFLMPTLASTDEVLLTTKGGSVVFRIIATPTITGVSNENAPTGDSVFIYGAYLKNIQAITFAGTSITSFVYSADGNSVGFVIPTLSQGGPVSVTTQFGTATTVYNVNDVSTGILADFEWGNHFGWQWWGGAAGPAWQNPSFPGNNTQYMPLNVAPLGPGTGDAASTALRLSRGQVIPTGSMSEPVDNWAIKFELSIPKPWNGGTLAIQTNYTSSYTVRLEPWQKAANTSEAFTTKGWRTVTVPFSEFRATDPTLGVGKGASLKKFVDLLGPSGNAELLFFIHNYGTSTAVTSFSGAFDNIRVVKIK